MHWNGYGITKPFWCLGTQVFCIVHYWLKCPCKHQIYIYILRNHKCYFTQSEIVFFLYVTEGFWDSKIFYFCHLSVPNTITNVLMTSWVEEKKEFDAVQKDGCRSDMNDMILELRSSKESTLPVVCGKNHTF